MKAIVAMAENRAIGKDGKLPWLTIKEDFKWFKEFTTNKMLVIGNKTFVTLPYLKNRNVVVLTKNFKCYEDGYDPFYNYAFCHRSFDDILKIDLHHKNNLICCGGASTYSLFLPYIDEFYVTHVKGMYDADTFMPPFEHLFAKKDVVKYVDGNEVMVYYSR